MRFGRRPYDDSADVEHLAWVNALHSDDQPASQSPARPVWRDPRNPAEQQMTPYDEWQYRREQRSEW
jgi:hypothetical protein